MENVKEYFELAKENNLEYPLTKDNLSREEKITKYINENVERFDFNSMRKILGENPIDYYWDEFQYIIENGLVDVKYGTISLTEKGVENKKAITALFYPRDFKENVLHQSEFNEIINLLYA